MRMALNLKYNYIAINMTAIASKTVAAYFHIFMHLCAVIYMSFMVCPVLCSVSCADLCRVLIV